MGAAILPITCIRRMYQSVGYPGNTTDVTWSMVIAAMAISFKWSELSTGFFKVCLFIYL